MVALLFFVGGKGGGKMDNPLNRSEWWFKSSKTFVGG